MEDELEKTVSVYGKNNNYNLIICENNTHKVISLNDFSKNEITFGRGKNNDIVLKSNIISGNHGKFVLNNGLYVVDNNSTNGIFINDQLKKESELSDRDILKIDNPNVSMEQAVVMMVIVGDVNLTYCPNCEKELNDSLMVKNENIETKKDDKEFVCLKCGYKIDNDKEFCPQCGTKKGEINNKKCHKCGNVLEEGKKFCSKCGEKVKIDIKDIPKNIKNSNNNNIKFIIIGIICALALIGFFTKKSADSEKAKKEKERYNNLPIKVDISMTSYYGTIEEILEEFDLDFDLVTMGGNCYTGLQKGTFPTKKYGVIYTEYSYCKVNKSLTFRLYNSENDQELRDPKPGEIPSFDKYGKKETSSSGA